MRVLTGLRADQLAIELGQHLLDAGLLELLAQVDRADGRLRGRDGLVARQLVGSDGRAAVHVLFRHQR